MVEQFQDRPYQDDMIDKTREALKTNRSVLLVSPTGSGKTRIASKMIHGAMKKGMTALFTVHRQELMDQSIEAFDKEGIEHGCIAAGYNFNPAMSVQIASIDTLRRRLEKFPFQPNLIVVDECAHSCSPTWEAVLNHFPRSRIVGLTATPERLDGKGLKKIYSAMVQGPSVRWLIDNSYLSDYEVFEPGVPDVSDLATRAGDFAIDQTESLMDTPSITGDAIREYKKHCDQKRAVAFCVSVKHSEHVAEQFRDAGVSSIHVDGNTPRAQRKAAVNAFRSGEIKVLTSVDIFGEGFDLPAMETAILLRPTQSLALYIQQVGRVLRKFPGKERALILDHAGNVRRHYLPDEPRKWSLEGREKKKKKDIEIEQKTKIRTCTKCFFTHTPTPKCPYCGYVYPVASREVEHKEGELQKLDKEALQKKKQLKIQEGRAQTRDELEAIGIERGYKNPFMWAEMKLAGRENREPDYAKAAARSKVAT